MITVVTGLHYAKLDLNGTLLAQSFARPTELGQALAEFAHKNADNHELVVEGKFGKTVWLDYQRAAELMDFDPESDEFKAVFEREMPSTLPRLPVIMLPWAPYEFDKLLHQNVIVVRSDKAFAEAQRYYRIHHKKMADAAFLPMYPHEFVGSHVGFLEMLGKHVCKDLTEYGSYERFTYKDCAIVVSEGHPGFAHFPVMTSEAYPAMNVSEHDPGIIDQIFAELEAKR